MRETSRIKNVVKGGTGEGLPDRILRAYKWICQNYKTEKDEIYLVGFSRGACTARAIARLLNDIDIMNPGSIDQEWASIWSEWIRQGRSGIDSTGHYKLITQSGYVGKKSTSKMSATLVEALRVRLHEHVVHHAVRIKVCAVFDTVRALYSWEGLGLSFLKDAVVDGAIDNAIQALALQKHRATFTPDLWQRTSRRDQYLKQCWFLGHHSDIGGGKRGASNVSLVWMMSEIKTRSNLQFNFGKITSALEAVGLLQNGEFVLKDSDLVPLPPGDREPGQYLHGVEETKECVHWSVQSLVSQNLYTRRTGSFGRTLALQGFEWNQRGSSAHWSNVTKGLNIPEEPIHGEEIQLLGRWIFQDGQRYFVNKDDPIQSADANDRSNLVVYASSTGSGFLHPGSGNTESAGDPVTSEHYMTGTGSDASPYYDTAMLSQLATYAPARPDHTSYVFYPQKSIEQLLDTFPHLNSAMQAPILDATHTNNSNDRYLLPQSVINASMSDPTTQLFWLRDAERRPLYAIDPIANRKLFAEYHNTGPYMGYYYRRNGLFLHID